MSDGFVFGGRTYQYAGFGRRVGAAMLDNAVWVIGISIYVPGALFQGAAGAIASVVLFSAWFNYFAICEWRWGQTIGKNMLGLRVMPLGGGRLTFRTASLRNLLRLVDGPLTLLFVTPVIVDRSPRRQRLGDRAADTIVVRQPQPEQAPATVESRPSPRAAELFPAATGALSAAAPASPGSGSPTVEPIAAEQGEPQPSEPPADAGDDGRRLPFADWPIGRTVRGVLAGLFLGGLFLPIPVLIADPELDSHAGLIAVQAILGVTLIATALIVAEAPRRRLGPALSRLGLRRVGPSAFGWAALAYFGYLALIAVYASFVVEPNQEDIARDLGLDAGVATAALSIVLIAFVAPVAEELFFRGVLYGGLRVKLGPILAALISGAVFGALHATTGITAVPPLVVFGVALALLYEKTGSLWPPIFLHFVNNSIALAVSA